MVKKDVLLKKTNIKKRLGILNNNKTSPCEMTFTTLENCFPDCTPWMCLSMKSGIQWLFTPLSPS